MATRLPPADRRLPPLRRIRWRRLWRLVPSRYPATGLWDRIADPADFEALAAIEGLTNPRIREELGALALVPRERRIGGPGASPVMAAFTHLNPAGSRFSDGSYGVYYGANSIATAIRETVFHRERFMRHTNEGPLVLQMRCYHSSLDCKLHDLRGGWRDEHDPDDYGPGQRLGRTLRERGADGLTYDSVRAPGAECAALFWPDVVGRCTQAAHYAYHWDGTHIATVVELKAVPLQPMPLMTENHPDQPPPKRRP